MKLDIFCHVLPQAYRARLLSSDAPAAANLQKRTEPIRSLWDVDERLQIMSEFDDYAQIISLAAPAPEALGGPEHVAELSAIGNDAMAEMCRRHPDAFPGFVASLPMQAPDLALAEVDRAIHDLDAVGVQIYTNVNGIPLDDPQFADFWAHMEAVDRPVWVHPTRNALSPDYAVETKSKHEIWWLFGWPYETGAFMARLVFSGIMERHPNLNVITHHAGGVVPFFAGRVGGGMDQYGARTPESERAEVLGEALPLRPIEYFKRFYADTAVFGAPSALKCAIEFFGAERMLFASDSPFDPEGGPGYTRLTIADVDGLSIDDEMRQAIYAGNARRLLELPARGAVAG